MHQTCRATKQNIKSNISNIIRFNSLKVRQILLVQERLHQILKPLPIFSQNMHQTSQETKQNIKSNISNIIRIFNRLKVGQILPLKI